jgi:large subunit ribosomal protein L17
LRNLASALFLTERDPFDDEENKPKVKGRIVTTIQKAKEVRPLVERCVAIAIRSLKYSEAAQAYSAPVDDTGATDRNSEAFLAWRKSQDYGKWKRAMAPVVNARRRVFALLRDNHAVRICFEDVAPRFVGRPGGYTRVMRLAKPRLGDAGTRAILEFVGVRDRTVQKAQAPQVEPETTPAT